MPIFDIGGRGGGGAGAGLGPAQNTFGDNSTASRAAAEALRNTYQGAHATWLAEYNDDLALWIRLDWDDGTVIQRRNGAGTAWEDVTQVITGLGEEQGGKPASWSSATSTPLWPRP